MPSFLSKVFGRQKRPEDKDPPAQSSADANRRLSSHSLLEGRFEAVSPTVSPSAEKFSEVPHNEIRQEGRKKEKEREEDNVKLAPAFFRGRSSSKGPSSPTSRDEVPHLTLNLPIPKDERRGRALGVVFETGPDGLVMDEAVIAERRLTPMETLALTRACARAICERGTHISL